MKNEVGKPNIVDKEKKKKKVIEVYSLSSDIKLRPL